MAHSVYIYIYICVYCYELCKPVAINCRSDEEIMSLLVQPRIHPSAKNYSYL
jgi:hypothetical protein